MPPKKKPETASRTRKLGQTKGPLAKGATPKPVVSDKDLAAAEKKKREHWAWQPVRNPKSAAGQAKSGRQWNRSVHPFGSREEKWRPPRAQIGSTFIRRAYFDA